MVNSNSATNVSLLSRLRRGDHTEESWREFVDRYGPKIYRWCVHRQLQPADADEVTQNVLVKMAAQLRQFDYDSTRSFRGWLRTVTENAVKDYAKNVLGKDRGDGGSQVLTRLAGIEATRDLNERLSEAFDLEIAELALERVCSRVASNRWMAWHLTARGQLAGADVAKQLNMKVASVYTARNQVEKLIREEIGAIEGKLN